MGWPSAIISPTKGPCLSQLQPDVSNYTELEESLLTEAGGLSGLCRLLDESINNSAS